VLFIDHRPKKNVPTATATTSSRTVTWRRTD
jgi:hypothetical protein